MKSPLVLGAALAVALASAAWAQTGSSGGGVSGSSGSGGINGSSSVTGTGSASGGVGSTGGSTGGASGDLGVGGLGTNGTAPAVPGTSSTGSGATGDPGAAPGTTGVNGSGSLNNGGGVAPGVNTLAGDGLPPAWSGSIGAAFFDGTTLRSEDQIRNNWATLSPEQQSRVRANCTSIADGTAASGGVTGDAALTPSFDQLCSTVSAL